MTRRRLLVVVALLVSLQGALLPGDGEAHYSSYCGHGESGYTIVTRYVGWKNQGGHWHHYRHQRWGAWDVHDPVWQLCNHVPH